MAPLSLCACSAEDSACSTTFLGECEVHEHSRKKSEESLESVFSIVCHCLLCLFFLCTTLDVVGKVFLKLNIHNKKMGGKKELENNNVEC